jgi:5'-nucleotidase
MRILCTNDDGIEARGLAFCAEICSGIGEVYCVAPDREQSATSHSLTLFKPLRPTSRGTRRWSVDGTPTDCVLLALGALLPARPDFVISGVNHGPNMGEDVLYSGTVAAAMEGLSLGVPAVAISFAGGEIDLLHTYRDSLEKLLRQVLTADRFPHDTLLNINLPPLPADQVQGVRITALGSRFYSESLQRMRDPWGREIYWIGGGHVNWTGGAESDFQAIHDGYVSVTPLHLDLTSYTQIESVRSWKLGE